MKIRKIKFKNINSLKGEFEINFEKFYDSGVFLISGKTGSGKTSILDAICVALYGETPRLSNPVSLMSKTTGECYSECEFEVKGKIYKSYWGVRRARNRPDGNIQSQKMRLSEFKDGEFEPVAEKIKEVKEKIEEITSFDFSRFTKSMMLAQGGFDEFLKASDKEKATLLEEITGTEIYGKISSKVYDKYIEKKNALEILKAKINNEGILKDDEEKEIKEKILNLKNELNILKKKINYFQTQKNLFEKKQNLEENIKKYQKELLILENEKKEFQRKYPNLELVKEKLEKASVISGEINLLKDRLKKEISDFEKKKSLLAVKNEEFEKLNKEFLKLSEILEDLQNEVDLLKKNEEKFKNLEVFKVKSSNLNDITQKILDLQKEFEKNQNLMSELEERYKSLSKDNVTKKLNIIEEKLKNFKNDIDYEALLEKSKEIKQKLDDINTFKQNQKVLEELNNTLTEINKNLEKLYKEKSKIEMDLEKLYEVKKSVRKIMDFEEERKNLKEGEPCPLCGALYHPYALKLPELKKGYEEEIKENEEKLKKINAKIETFEKEKSKIEAKIEYLKKENEKLEIEDENKLKRSLEEVEKLLNEYKTQKSQKEKLEKERDILKEELNRLEKEEITIKEKLKNLNINNQNRLDSLKELNSKKNSLEKELKDNLGENFEKEILKLEEEAKKYEELLKKLKQCQEEKNNVLNKKAVVEKEILNLEKELSVKENDLANLKNEINKKENTLNEILENRDFFELKKEYEDAVKLKEILNQKFAAINAKLKEAKNELKSIDLDKNIDFSTLDEVIKELEEKRDFLIQEITKNEEIIKRSVELREKQNSLLKEIEEKEKEFKYYEMLYKLIGQKDGGKFKTFVQNLTLKYLISLANKHLKNLTDRYFLTKENENNLEISVIDMYQGNIKRSVNTLSGGESFLISLSLALGLTDLVSDKIKVDTLFIDEGFGTLDEDTLNTVIETLEKLQNRGKIIGIISHVKELKERINAQIKVIKKRNGFSDIYLVI